MIRKGQQFKKKSNGAIFIINKFDERKDVVYFNEKQYLCLKYMDRVDFLKVFELVSSPQAQKLEAIANRLAEVRDWMEIPEETHAGINGIIDDLNEVITELT